MRADIQRKPLGFQELTSPKYRCVEFCVVDLMQLLELLTDSLVLKTKGILEHPFSTSLFQSGFRLVSVTLSNACNARGC